MALTVDVMAYLRARGTDFVHRGDGVVQKDACGVGLWVAVLVSCIVCLL